MCAHGCRQLHAFDFLPHLLLGLDNHARGLNYHAMKICCNHPKSLTRWFFIRVMHPKDAEGIANSVDPDQTAFLEAV